VQVSKADQEPNQKKQRLQTDRKDEVAGWHTLTASEKRHFFAWRGVFSLDLPFNGRPQKPASVLDEQINQ